jgi:hypothetical protein
VHRAITAPIKVPLNRPSPLIGSPQCGCRNSVADFPGMMRPSFVDDLPGFTIVNPEDGAKDLGDLAVAVCQQG